MYSREYGGQVLSFEASGGLMNSSLVMQDRETDTYWSIMSGQAEAGPLKGTELQELPVSEKVRWAEWRDRHPDTLVLTVGGREHAPDSYARYWDSDEGFRGQEAEDERLDTKTPIYAFEAGGQRFAVPHEAVEGGQTFELPGGDVLFLFREPGDEIFASTAAYVSPDGFARQDGTWVEQGTGATFDPDAHTFTGGEVRRQPGFDTFWYNWSLNNPDTEVLR